MKSVCQFAPELFPLFPCIKSVSVIKNKPRKVQLHFVAKFMRNSAIEVNEKWCIFVMYHHAAGRLNNFSDGKKSMSSCLRPFSHPEQHI